MIAVSNSSISCSTQKKGSIQIDEDLETIKLLITIPQDTTSAPQSTNKAANSYITNAAQCTQYTKSHTLIATTPGQRRGMNECFIRKRRLSTIPKNKQSNHCGESTFTLSTMNIMKTFLSAGNRENQANISGLTNEVRKNEKNSWYDLACPRMLLLADYVKVMCASCCKKNTQELRKARR
jgi:hypothetical protein